MNYSPSFRWNYFSRIVNLDFGYLLFDFACRCMEVEIGLIVVDSGDRRGRTAADVD